MGLSWRGNGLREEQILEHSTLNTAQCKHLLLSIRGASLVTQMVKSACNVGDPVQSLRREDPLQKGMAAHSSILAWKYPWTEEHGGLQSMGSQTVGHNWTTNTHIHTIHIIIILFTFIFFPFVFISWKLITLQYCSGFCHTLTWISHGFTCFPNPDLPSRLPLFTLKHDGINNLFCHHTLITATVCWASQVALVVKNPPANAGDLRNMSFIPRSRRFPGGGHSNPLQCSCLENPMARGACRATVHGIAESDTTEVT